MVQQVVVLKLLVDWNGNGLFDHPLSDITSDVLSCTYNYGRDIPIPSTGLSVSGGIDCPD